jgi:hypothetical protein
MKSILRMCVSLVGVSSTLALAGGPVILAPGQAVNLGGTLVVCKQNVIPQPIPVPVNRACRIDYQSGRWNIYAGMNYVDYYLSYADARNKVDLLEREGACLWPQTHGAYKPQCAIRNNGSRFDVYSGALYVDYYLTYDQALNRVRQLEARQDCLYY